MEKKKRKEILPLFVPTERLPLEGLATLPSLLFLRMQKARASKRTRATKTEPTMIPTKAPTVNPFFDSDDLPSVLCGCVPDPERLRLLLDLPGGGGLYSGGGGAGPLSKEFPSYLYQL